jgi:hypothetical protein
MIIYGASFSPFVRKTVVFATLGHAATLAREKAVLAA